MKSLARRKRKGKTFYAFHVLLTAFITIPLLAALAVSLGALREAGKDSRRNFNAAMEAQIRYAQSIGLGREHAGHIKALRKEFWLSGGFGKNVQDKDEFDSARLEKAMRAVETAGPPEQTRWYLYFAANDYLVGLGHTGEDARKYETPRALGFLNQIDVSDTGYSRNRFGIDENGERYLIYAGVVAPQIVFLYERDFGPGGLGNNYLSSGLTANLAELEMANYDSFGNRLPVTENQELAGLYGYDSIGDGSGSFSFTRNGRGYLCFYLHNRDNQTKFALFCRDNLGDAYRSATLLLLVGALCALVVFLVFATTFLRRAWSPIDRIIARLPQDGNGTANRDDFRTIADALDSMDSKIRRQNELLGRSYLLRVLKRQSIEDYEGDPAGWLSPDDRGDFAVAAVRGESAGDSGLPDDKDLEDGLKAYFVRAGWDLAAAWDGDYLFAAFKMRGRDLADLAGEFEAYQADPRNLSVSVYIGGIHSGGRELHRCCSEALAAAEYCLIQEKYGTVQRYDAIGPASRGTAAVSLDFRQLQNLSDCTAALNRKDALALLDSIAESCAQRLGRPLGQEDMAFSVLVNTLALSFYDIALPGDISKATVHRYAERVRGSADPGDLHELVDRSLEEFGNLNNTQNSDQKRFEQIKAYIYENFKDPNLYSVAIADRFGTSPSNITRMFKKYNSTGFLEYVHQLRVTEAVRLLETTRLTTAAVASKVGYTNGITMIRAFKRYANSTPGMIRKRQGKAGI